MLASEACHLARSLVEMSVDGVDVVVAPSFTSLSAVSHVIKNSRLGLAGQNFHSEVKGAYTGEVSLEMLNDVGCGYVLIGHSERRKLFGESDADVNKKVYLALEMGFTAVVCIGETQEQRESGENLSVIESQLQQGLAGLSCESIAHLVIAYEPLWAIGTGLNATPEQAVETHKFIRRFLFENQGVSEKTGVRILYGGSVTPENCKELLSEEEIDGVLVGGASLNFKSFYAIIKSSLEP
jgi:triosephosphate isomerase (TIM)